MTPSLRTALPGFAPEAYRMCSTQLRKVLSMNIPLKKNRAWIAAIHDAIDHLNENAKSEVMKGPGEQCAKDLIALCEKLLGAEIASVNDLVRGWNELRSQRCLCGGWEFDGNIVTGIFSECGCPLVRSGLMELHPIQCFCSHGMLESVFSRFGRNPVEVQIKRSIGRGDPVCEFLIKT